ncbi:MAG: YceI family protein [Candidatus Acidiferrum sp.]
MRVTSWKSALATVSGTCGIALLLSATATPPRQQSASANAQEIVLELDPAQSKVHYSVDSTLHTVHGTFALKSGTVHFDPESGKAGGEVSVFATSGDSGNSGRDERMHKEILQTAKYPDAIFRPEQIEGKVARSGASDVKLHGVIQLHGQEHEMVAAVHAELSGDHWKGTAKFDVPYVQWGIKNPSSWLLKVKAVVNVELEMSGSVRSAK